MKKNRFTAIAASAFLAACLTVPMAASMPVGATATANTVTITGEIGTKHTYTVYQIFTGEVTSSDNQLTKIAFAKTDEGAFDSFLSALKSDKTIGSDFTKASSVAEVANVLSSYTNNTNQAKAFAKFVASNPTLVKKIQTNATSSICLENDGYYLIVDNAPTGTETDFAVSSYLLTQYDASAGAEITVKSAKPTVDKQVQDETADAEDKTTSGWGETADHAINESFKFKLTATIPEDTDLSDYSTYKVVFHDTLSNGVTFESIESVKVGDKTLSASDYTASTADSGSEWTLTIDDIISYLTEGSTLSAGTTVEVIYNAHLNENAVVSKSSKDSSSDINNNKVYLEYSNNPNGNGTGQTTEDYVWVFTYGVDNTKYHDEATTGNELANAGFKLYSDSNCTSEIALVETSTTGTYRPATSDESGVEMKSSNDGTFNIIGLDAGTYYLKETATPTGYNTCENIKITISAKHSEITDGTAAKLDLTGSSNMSNSVINVSGSTLPSTGGIGTTLFYVGGGCMVGLAGIFLITKKRMGKKND